jgi:hypothetical protein
MDVRSAIYAAKKCRPIIDPIGQLPEFLMRLRKACEAENSTIGRVRSESKSSDDGRKPKRTTSK